MLHVLWNWSRSSWVWNAWHQTWSKHVKLIVDVIMIDNDVVVLSKPCRSIVVVVHVEDGVRCGHYWVLVVLRGMVHVDVRLK